MTYLPLPSDIDLALTAAVPAYLVNLGVVGDKPADLVSPVGQHMCAHAYVQAYCAVLRIQSSVIQRYKNSLTFSDT